jgi:hypothetical protein
VPLERQARFLGRHTTAVVHHANEALASRLYVDDDAPCTGVNGVFAQLLDHRRGPFHHLASGDLVGHFGRQYPDPRVGGHGPVS